MTRVQRIVSGRSAIAAILLAGAFTGLRALPASADLSSRYSAGQHRAQALQSQVNDESQQIQQYQGSIDSLQQRLVAVQHSVDVQEAQMRSATDQLSADRVRLRSLRIAFRRDRKALAAQLRAQYESPPPSLVNVVVSAGGFNSLINSISYMAKLRHANLRTVA